MGSRAFVRLTDRQKVIIIGKILGDGCLEKNGRYTRLKIEQGQKQRNYVFWLYNEFIPFVPSKPYAMKVQREEKWDIKWRFATYSLPIFDQFRTLFYKEKKTIPPNINKILVDPLSLAIWYMDDGYKRTDESGVYLCTSAFGYQEHSLLRDCLERNFGLLSNIHYAGGYPRIYFPAVFARKFCQLIRPFVLETLSYKLL